MKLPLLYPKCIVRFFFNIFHYISDESKYAAIRIHKGPFSRRISHYIKYHTIRIPQFSLCKMKVQICIVSLLYHSQTLTLSRIFELLVRLYLIQLENVSCHLN